MAKVHVTAKRDFLQSLTIARPVAAVAQLIWNGFDAQSELVQVRLERNEMDGIQTIRIRDYGDGINFADVNELFGSLGESWKKNKARLNGRGLHGKSGKGRFKAFALGQLVEWNTTFEHDRKRWTYKITGSALALDDFEVSTPVEDGGSATGTEVVISNVVRNFPSLDDGSAPLELAKIFAPYLTENPGLTLEYNGFTVDPQSAQRNREDYPLGDVELPDGRKTAVSVSIIEWNIPTDRALHLCDSSGISLHETEVGQQVRAPGFNFTAYVKSEHFRELDKTNQLVLAELHPDALAILKSAWNKIREHFRRRAAEDQSKIVER